MTVVYYVVIFWIGVLAGFALKTWMQYKFRSYSGTLVVGKDERREKTVYSLVLDDYPEELTFRKEVVFKVDTSEQSS